MRKIKHLALGIIGATLVTVGIFSCSNDEVNKSPQENTEQKSNLQHKDDGTIEIGRITDRENNAEFTIDIEKFKTEILKYDVLAEIESVEIDATYLTIIGKDKEDFSLVAFQAKLLKDGNSLYFPNPTSSDPDLTTFSADTCAGTNCSSCAFTRKNGNKGAITGCTCNEKIDPEKPGGCNHTTTSGSLLDKVKKWVDMAVAVLGLFKL